MKKYIIGAIILGIIIGLCAPTKKAEVISPIPPGYSPTPASTIIPTPATEFPVKVGLASYYSKAGCLGCSKNFTMANGEKLDDGALTVAYNDAPLNSFITVQSVNTGKKVRARVTDTGGFKRHGKIIDLTIATRDAIGCGSVCEVVIIAEGGE